MKYEGFKNLTYNPKRNQKPNVGIVEESAPTSIGSGLPTKKVHKPAKNFMEK